MSPCVPYELQRCTWRVFYVLLKRSGTPVWHEPIGFGASGRAGLRAFAELVVARRSWGDLQTTMRSRETLCCLHQSSVSHVDRRYPTARKDSIGRCSKPTGTRLIVTEPLAQPRCFSATTVAALWMCCCTHIGLSVRAICTDPAGANLAIVASDPVGKTVSKAQIGVIWPLCILRVDSLWTNHSRW